MTNKFNNFALTTVYVKGDYFEHRYDDMLVDVENNKLIYCNYVKSPILDEVACVVLDIPITKVEKGKVEISFQTLAHKLSSGHFKKIDYEDLCIEKGQNNFTIFV